MKKVLLIGELNQTVNSVNRHLMTRFRTQLCVDSLDVIKGMVKVFEPDIAIVCLVGIGELDSSILDFFQGMDSPIPVLLIGTSDECRYYHTYYENKQFDFVVRPTTLSVLLQKCLDMMRVTDEEEESVDYKIRKLTGEKRHILAVDDSGILLRSVKSILGKQYEVTLATSGKMAIQQAKKTHPDLILLDYEMPNMDGRETLEQIREDEELKEIPVIFLTGVADKEHISAVLKLNPAGYLLKPIERQRLLDVIEKVLMEFYM